MLETIAVPVAQAGHICFTTLGVMRHMNLVAMPCLEPARGGPLDLLLVFAMWAEMMVAMMVPSATPHAAAFAH
jgi:predicted metal-binding membrane protein